MNYFYFIMFFGVYITTIYVYTKIQNIQNIKNNFKVCAVVFSLIMSIPLSYITTIGFVFILTTFIFLYVIFRDDISKTFYTLLISLGIVVGFNIVIYFISNYFFWYFFQYLFSMICYYISYTDYLFVYLYEKYTAEYAMYFEYIVALLTSILVFISVLFLFRIKRFKNGFAFLKIKEAVWTGAIFSVVIIFTKSSTRSMSAYINNAESTILLWQYRLLITTCILVIIHIWWRYHTRTVYQLRINERTLNEQQLEIDKLTASNKFLSETVHRDNKLIPAMYSTLQEYLGINNEKNKGYIFLGELDELMKERKEKISKFNKNNSIFSSTGLSRIDSIISYMHSIALEKNIDLIVASVGNIKEIIEMNCISKSSLETMLADLLENAIIATSFSENKKILLTIGVIDDCYEFEIKDSGIPFELKTLNNLGIKKATTHSESGGSGIGYLKIFEILKETNSSFILNEEETDKSVYTKSIKIRFDNKHNFIIYSNRTEHIKNPKMNKQVFSKE